MRHRRDTAAKDGKPAPRYDRRMKIRVRIFLMTAMASGVMGHAQAAELKILTAGAFKPMVTALAPEFERRGGDALRIENDTAGALVRRLDAGEPCDVAILTRDALAGLAARNEVAPGTIRPLARVGIGVAVRHGAPRPDVATAAAFEAALLAAPSVAYLDPAVCGRAQARRAAAFIDYLRSPAAAALLRDKGMEPAC